jgi:hypothetical protein
MVGWILIAKSEGKTQLGRPRSKWDNNEIDLREIGWGGIDLIYFD